MSFLKILVALALAALLIPPGALAQAADDEVNDDGVLMLEEILIEVAPELPTVLVTITRQKPTIEREITIKDPLKRLMQVKKSQLKPDLTKMKVTEIKDAKRILARERKR